MFNFYTENKKITTLSIYHDIKNNTSKNTLTITQFFLNIITKSKPNEDPK